MRMWRLGYILVTFYTHPRDHPQKLASQQNNNAMDYIRKSIYRLPEIRRTLLPLWTAWITTLAGAVCGAVYLTSGNLATGISTALLSGVLVGGCSLLTVVCYYLFGDSRRPYSRELKAVLEPTYTYYSQSQQQTVTKALQSHDEKALESIKRSTKPELALVRYSDKAERVYYSQLTRVEGNHYIPLTDIIVNHTKTENNG